MIQMLSQSTMIKLKVPHIQECKETKPRLLHWCYPKADNYNIELCQSQAGRTLYQSDNSLIWCNIVVTPKSRKMGLFLPFDIKDKIFKENLLQLLENDCLIMFNTMTKIYTHGCKI